jgi:hypothetical protein
VVQLLFWITARDRTTGAAWSLGISSGADRLSLTIDGVSRTYEPSNGNLTARPIVTSAGVSVRMQTVTLSGVSPMVREALLAYDPRLAPVELHRLVADPETGVLAGPPRLIFRGTVDKARLPRPEKGGTASIELTLASATRDLTRRLMLKKSDQSQRLRDPDDAFRAYADVSGMVDVFWGANRYRPVVAPPATAAGPEEPPRSGSDR